MSIHKENTRITAPQIRDKKGPGSIVSLTAYTTPMAEMMDPYVDLIIVGDSTGMVAYGLSDTLGVTLDMMINHGAAVVRGAKKACVVIDMPFATYQESPVQAYRNAAKVIRKTGAQAVKMEGGSELTETVKFLVDRGIPVMPHIGLMPQHVNTMGGYKAQARTDEEGEQLVELSKAFEYAGAFSILIEGTYEAAARKITEALHIPTIGIGASPACDGQVLVTEDVLGLFTAFTPKFAKRYIDLSVPAKAAFAEYEREVRNSAFPSGEHCFGVKKG